MPAEKKTDLELLDELLDDYEDRLTEWELEAFPPWIIDLRTKRIRSLTEKQKNRLYAAGERLGLLGAAPAENLFSQMTPAKQAEERRKAAKVRLPWEK